MKIHPTPGTGLPPTSRPVVEQPRVLVVELLEGVVGEHDGAGPLGDPEHEGVAPADGAGRRRHRPRRGARPPRAGPAPTGRSGARTRRRRRRRSRPSGSSARYARTASSSWARLGSGPALGGQVRAVDDDVVGARPSRASVKHPDGGASVTRPPLVSRWPDPGGRPAPAACRAALPVAGLADSGRLTWRSR